MQSQAVRPHIQLLVVFYCLFYFVVFIFPLVLNPLFLPLWVSLPPWSSSPALITLTRSPSRSFCCIYSPCVPPCCCQYVFCVCAKNSSDYPSVGFWLLPVSSAPSLPVPAGLFYWPPVYQTLLTKDFYLNLNSVLKSCFRVHELVLT